MAYKSKSRKRTVSIEVTEEMDRKYQDAYFFALQYGFWIENKVDEEPVHHHKPPMPWYVDSSGSVLPDINDTHPDMKEWCQWMGLRSSIPEMLDWCRSQRRPIKGMRWKPNLGRIDFVFKNSVDATLFKLFFG